MTIVTELQITASEFELGPVGDATALFEQSVSAQGSLFPYVWVRGDQLQLCERVEDNPAIESFKQISENDSSDGVLYKIGWKNETAGFLSCLRESNPVVLEASGYGDTWSFQLRFDSHEDLSAFQRVCRDHDIIPSIQRLVTDGSVSAPGVPFTDLQRETLEVALESGYFDVPRKTTMVDIADKLDISDQAVSARIRRASKNMLEHVLQTDDGQSETAPEKPEP